MARFRKIDTRIWNDEKFRALSDDGQLIFLFVLTHPHMTSLGAMRATLAGLAAEKGWTETRFKKGFAEPFRKGMVNYDERASFVWVKNFLRYNAPENPNVVKSWATSLDLLPECPMKTQLIQSCKEYAKGLPKGFAEGLPEPFRKGMPNQEPEPEPEKDTPPSPSPGDVSIENMLEGWENLCVPEGLPTRRLITVALTKKIQARLREHPTEEFWQVVFDKLCQSDFLSGRTGNWRATLDWLVKNPDNCVKVYEGGYANVRQA